MRDLELPFADRQDALPEIVRGRKLVGKASATLVAAGDDFETRAVGSFEVDFDGIKGDHHRGATRKSGGREPWYPRGTEMRNERQISIVSTDEMREVADRMGLAEVLPEWIGANLVIDGVPMLSMLPSGTLLFFKGGVTLKVDGQNHPCRLAGRLVAKRAGLPETPESELRFPQSAQRLRGLVAWVEKPGVISAGEDVSVRIPEQWIYPA